MRTRHQPNVFGANMLLVFRSNKVARAPDGFGMWYESGKHLPGQKQQNRTHANAFTFAVKRLGRDEKATVPRVFGAFETHGASIRDRSKPREHLP